MSKNIIFYFTGTGNSLKAARDIANRLEDCDVFLMTAYKEQYVPEGYDRIGFVFPVYAEGLPNCVERFISETDFSASSNAYFFTVATYGALSGNSIYQVNKLLGHKGIRLNAGIGIKMFANYVVLYNMSKKVNKIRDKSQIAIHIAAEKIKKKSPL